MTVPAQQPPTPQEVQGFVDTFGRVVSNVELAVLGKNQVVRLALTALFAEGHLLIEDVPGTGKTSLARGPSRRACRASGGGSSSPRTCCRRTCPA